MVVHLRPSSVDLWFRRGHRDCQGTPRHLVARNARRSSNASAAMSGCRCCSSRAFAMPVELERNEAIVGGMCRVNIVPPFFAGSNRCRGCCRVGSWAVRRTLVCVGAIEPAPQDRLGIRQQPRVQCLQPLGLRHLHTAELRLPFVVVREELDSARNELKWEDELGEDLVQQKLEPADEATEVVAGGGEDGIGVSAGRKLLKSAV